MPKGTPNKLTDVFRQIDMKGGDKEQCWPWVGRYLAKKLDPNDTRPIFKQGGRSHTAYRIVLHLYDPSFNINDPTNLVRHKCDNKGVFKDQRCCNPHHLTHGTHKTNMQDMVDRERSGLPKHVVRYIYKLMHEKDDEGYPMYTALEIAKRWGVSRQTVQAIKSGARHGKETHKGEDVYERQFKAREYKLGAEPNIRLRDGEFGQHDKPSNQSNTEGAEAEDGTAQDGDGSEASSEGSSGEVEESTSKE